MNLSFSLSKITPQIKSERLKGYKWILSGQIIIAITFLFVYELLERYPLPNWQLILVGFIGTLMMFMNYLSYEIIKDLTDNYFIQKLILILLWVGVLAGVINSLELVAIGSFAYQVISICSITTSLMAFVILLYYMIFDIFKEKHDIVYRLWGSASIYMLIGASFGLFFTLLEMLFPLEFGLDNSFNIFHFIPCYNFSYYNLAGMDCPYNFSIIVRNVAVVESIFSNLYIVLVVGRLLSK